MIRSKDSDTDEYLAFWSGLFSCEVITAKNLKISHKAEPDLSCVLPSDSQCLWRMLVISVVSRHPFQ